MRKFYSTLAGLFFLLLLSAVTHAQVYSTLPSGGLVSDVATWDVNGIPPDPCTGCTININGPVTVDFSLTMFGGSINIHNNATLAVDAFITLVSASVIVGSNVTVGIHDEIHLYGLSNVRLADQTSILDGTNPGLNPSHGTIDNGNPDAAGIYFSRVAYPNITTSYDIVYTQFGFGGPFPPTGSTVVYTTYDINCNAVAPPPICVPEKVYGPAQINASHLFESAPVLPVVLAKFAAILNDDNTVNVSWATAQEVNSDYFSVERSTNGADWSVIGTVKAKGFSSIAQDYTFRDVSPLNATNYYRLQIVDLDGKFKISKVATVKLDGKSAPLVVYSNPFTDLVRLKVNTSTADNLSLTLTDLNGRAVVRQQVTTQAGDTFINLSPSGAAKGLYILNIKGQHYNQTVKLVRE